MLINEINRLRKLIGINEGIVSSEDINCIMRGYLGAAMWTEGERLDGEYNGNERDSDDLENLGLGRDTFGVDNIESDSLIKVYEDIKKFINMCGNEVIGVAIGEHGCDQLGHDLWLTRNGHGAGFFDRGYDDEVEGILMRCAQGLGMVDLYINDNSLSFSNENI